MALVVVAIVTSLVVSLSMGVIHKKMNMISQDCCEERIAGYYACVNKYTTTPDPPSKDYNPVKWKSHADEKWRHQ